MLLKTNFYLIIISLIIGLFGIKFFSSSKHASKILLVNEPKVSRLIGLPTKSQASIDMALNYFKIEIPFAASHPIYDENLRDRGLSIMRVSSPKIAVQIGPAAFTSWAVLGSTLAHELEIHCLQNFYAIDLLDSAGVEATQLAERVAYEYEIANAKRFGLTEENVKQIMQTLDYYYPIKDSAMKNVTATEIASGLTKQLIKVGL